MRLRFRPYRFLRLLWDFLKSLIKYEFLLNLKEETGYSLQTLSAAYLISSPFQVFPVTGARNTEQLEDIVRAGEIYIEPERFRLNGYDSGKRSENIIR